MNILTIKKIFAKDQMFLGNDGRLYRYEIKDGVVKTYQKSGSSNVTEQRSPRYFYPQNESDFWLIKPDSYYQVHFKQPDGLHIAVKSRWNDDWRPVIYGDLLFTISDIRRIDRNPYNRVTEPIYRVYRALADKNDFVDITSDSIPAGYNIVKIEPVSYDKVALKLKRQNSERVYPELVYLDYIPQDKVFYQETVKWEPLTLLQGQQTLLLKASK